MSQTKPEIFCTNQTITNLIQQYINTCIVERLFTPNEIHQVERGRQAAPTGEREPQHAQHEPR